jgi:hypothetical protein
MPLGKMFGKYFSYSRLAFENVFTDKNMKSERRG